MGSYNRNNQYLYPPNFRTDRFGDLEDDYDEDTDAQSVEDERWQERVDDQGQLFYIEPSDPIEYVTPGASRRSHSPTLTHFQNGSGHPNATKYRKKRGLRGLLGSEKSNRKLLDSPALTDRALSRHDQNGGGSVTFNDVPTGVTRELTIFVDPFRRTVGRRTSRCEALFGIVPGHFGAPSLDSAGSAGAHSGSSSGPTSDKRVMVQGLMPWEPAAKAGVKIGEWLMSVNDLEVTSDNLDSLLSEITGPRFIKLTLQKIAVQTSPRRIFIRRAPALDDHVTRLVSGLDAQTTQQDAAARLKHLPHAAIFLSMDCASESMADKEDVVYQFPHADTRLVALRGLFLTLTHVMRDVTKSCVRSSSLVVDGRLCYVAYHVVQRHVFLLCLPAYRVSLQQLNTLMNNVVRLLKVLHGSLQHAFSDHQRALQLDHVFTLLFYKLLLSEQFYQTPPTLTNSPGGGEGGGISNSTSETETRGGDTGGGVSGGGAKPTGQATQTTPLSQVFCESLNTAVRAATLPDHTKLTIDNCLSELEAADFADMSEAYYDMRRMYTIMGSCLFYKGYLLASHLPASDLQDIALYLRYHFVLTLSGEAQLGQLLLWREVYPTRRCHVQSEPVLAGFTEPRPARFFLLVVGMKNLLVSVLLEAGGCASPARGCPGPDPCYVDQVRATLLQLEALDVISQCENRLKSSPLPSLSCAKDFVKTSKSSKQSADDVNRNAANQNSPQPSNHGAANSYRGSTTKYPPEGILKKRGADGKQGRGYDVDSDVDSHSTGTSEGSVPFLSKIWSWSQASDEFGSAPSALFQGARKHRNMPSLYDMGALRRNLEDVEGPRGAHVKLTSGCDNTLFTYLHVDSLEGVLVCPVQQELPGTASPLHTQLLNNFQQAGLSIRELFMQSRQAQSLSIDKTEVGRFSPDRALGHVMEHGVLFECSAHAQPGQTTEGKKAPRKLSYWVVGRLFKEPVEREVYVCFQDSAQQSVIEMAFKLSYAMTL